MSCLYDFPPERQQQAVDIVRGDPQATAELGAFLEALQDNPLPAARQWLSPHDATSFWCRLNCGIYVSWKIEASPEDMIKLWTGHVSPAIVIKVLGIERGAPPGM
jgi:hypothetical protein